MERGVLARALYTNTPEAKNELFFRKGDILTVIEIDHENQPGWWLCSLRGQRGICPSNYFELMEDKYSRPTTALPASTTSHANSNSNPNIVRGGVLRRAGETESVPDSNSVTSSSSSGLSCPPVLDPLETYDVPKSYRDHLPPSSSSPSPAPLSKVSPLELYDVPRSQLPIYATNSHGNSNANSISNDSLSLVRAKNRQSELSLLSTGSSAHLSSSGSSSSSSARSSASCDLSTAVVVKSNEHLEEEDEEASIINLQNPPHHHHDSSSFFSQNNNSNSNNDNTVENSSDKEKEGKIPYNNSTSSNRSSVQSDSNNSNNSDSNNSNNFAMVTSMVTPLQELQELYDIPRSAPTSRAQSAMSALSMSSGLGLSIANSDSKDSLDLYDVPRSSANSVINSQGSVHAYVNHIETKYDHVQHNNSSSSSNNYNNRTTIGTPPPPPHRNSCSSSTNGLNLGYVKSSRTASSSCDLGSSGINNRVPPPLSKAASIAGDVSSAGTRKNSSSTGALLGKVQSQSQNQSHDQASASVPAPDDLYDIPRSSCPVVTRHNYNNHNNNASMSSSLASMAMAMSKESLRGSIRDHPPSSSSSNSRFGSSFDVRRRGFIQTTTRTDSTDTLSFPLSQSHSQSQHSSYDMLDEDFQASNFSINSNGYSKSRASGGGSRSCCSSTRSSKSYMDDGGGIQRRASQGGQTQTQHQNQHQSEEDVKILPLNARAAVTVSEKLRHEVITSIKSILDFVRPKWRSKSNLVEIMPDLRFSCTRLNLAIKDMADFCSRSVSNAKRFGGEALVTKLQRLLTPLINGSQIIQRDVDELEAYFWSVERLSVSGDGGKAMPPDCLDQLVLCAKSLKNDVTEVSNFLALNSSSLFQEPDRLNPPVTNTNNSTISNATTVQTGSAEVQGVEIGPAEDYDYVSLVPMDEGACGHESSSSEAGQLDSVDSCNVQTEATTTTTTTVHLLPSDEQLLEFYSAQIAFTAPLLSQSIATFISSIQQNDPPKTFNGHLKYVILLAYKMLFAGDTVHRNIINAEIKEEVESKANELHKSVVSLHEASRDAAKNFPKIPPMQKIVDRVWETTAAATQLKKVMFNAACFL